MKKEVNSVLGIVIIVIVSALMCFLTMFIIGAKKDVTENNPSNDKNTAEKNEVKYEKIENIDVIAKNFFDNYVEKMMRLNATVFFNDRKKINFNDISLDERMSIIYNLTKEKWDVSSSGDFEIKTISAQEFKSYYVKLFAENSYSDKSFLNEFWWFKNPTSVEYDNSNNQYRATIIAGGMGQSSYDEDYYYNKAVQVGNKIEIYVNVAYKFVKDGYNCTLYSDYTMKNFVAEVTLESDLTNYIDKLGLQKYTLVKDTNTNNYVLESIEVVK